MAEACSYYGWTVEYVLQMPIKRLFVMLDCARAIESRRMMTACDVQAISLCDSKYYTELRNSFESGIPASRKAVPNVIQAVKEDRPYDAIAEQNALVSVFGGR